MSARKTILGVLGAVFALLGMGLLAAGGAVVWATATNRTPEGYISNQATAVSTDTYALTSTQLDLGGLRNDWLLRLQGDGDGRRCDGSDAPGLGSDGPDHDIG